MRKVTCVSLRRAGKAAMVFCVFDRQDLVWVRHFSRKRHVNAIAFLRPRSVVARTTLDDVERAGPRVYFFLVSVGVEDGVHEELFLCGKINVTWLRMRADVRWCTRRDGAAAHRPPSRGLGLRRRDPRPPSSSTKFPNTSNLELWSKRPGLCEAFTRA